jgi:hypothetical protein
MSKAEKQYDKALRKVSRLETRLALARIEANNAQIVLGNERRAAAQQ